MFHECPTLIHHRRLMFPFYYIFFIVTMFPKERLRRIICTTRSPVLLLNLFNGLFYQFKRYMPQRSSLSSKCSVFTLNQLTIFCLSKFQKQFLNTIFYKNCCVWFCFIFNTIYQLSLEYTKRAFYTLFGSFAQYSIKHLKILYI